MCLVVWLPVVLGAVCGFGDVFAVVATAEVVVVLVVAAGAVVGGWRAILVDEHTTTHVLSTDCTQ